MNTPGFKLYPVPELPMTSKDRARHTGPKRFFGHVVIGMTTYGIEARLVTAGIGKDARRHFEGNVIDWQELIRKYVAKPTGGKPTPQTELFE